MYICLKMSLNCGIISSVEGIHYVNHKIPTFVCLAYDCEWVLSLRTQIRQTVFIQSICMCHLTPKSLFIKLQLHI